MAKKSAKRKKSTGKKAPSEAQLAARAAFAARARGGKSSGKPSKSSKKSKSSGRMNEPQTARSAKFKDDSSSTYERAATVPVAVPKPEPLPNSSPEAVPQRKISYVSPLYVPPMSGGSVKRQSATSTSFFI
jgi:hypothetical protein